MRLVGECRHGRVRCLWFLVIRGSGLLQGEAGRCLRVCWGKERKKERREEKEKEKVRPTLVL